MIKKLSFFLPIIKFKVHGNSMYPLVKEADTVLVHKYQQLRVGDMVVLKSPNLKHNFIIKKIEKKKQNMYFVVGENKKESTDSRRFGWVSKKYILGKATKL